MNKKALSLIEVMVFFLVTAVLLIITIPAITTKKAQKMCVPGGTIVFDGSENVIGDKDGLIKVSCSKIKDDDGNDAIDPETGEELKICEYLWKAPQSEIYVTSVGGGGGGSGVLSRDDSCEALLAMGGVYYDTATKTYKCEKLGRVPNYSYSICNPELHESTNIKTDRYVRPFSAWIGNTSEALDESLKHKSTFVDLFTNNGYDESMGEQVYEKLKDENSKLGDDEEGDLIQKVGAERYCSYKERDSNRIEPCSLDLNGEEVYGGEAGCQSKDVLRTETLFGAGGTGGYYTFGENYNYNSSLDGIDTSGKPKNDGYDDYTENLAQPVAVRAGHVYKIIVGQGGLGGKMVNVISYNDVTPSTIAGENLKIEGKDGFGSCLKQSWGHGQEQCTASDLAYAGGGFGAPGYISYKTKFLSYFRHKNDTSSVSRNYFNTIGYQIIFSKDSLNELRIFATYPFNYTKMFQGYSSLEGLDYDPEITSLKQQITSLFTYPEAFYYDSVVDQSRFTVALGFLQNHGFPPQALGLPGTYLFPGKGGPSLYGMDRPGSGGDGGYKDTNDSRMKNSKLQNLVGQGRPGKNGLVEIRWFTTCN